MIVGVIPVTTVSMMCILGEGGRGQRRGKRERREGKRMGSRLFKLRGLVDGE